MSPFELLLLGVAVFLIIFGLLEGYDDWRERQ